MSYIELKNDLGMKVTLCTIGAGLYDIEAPDREGKIESVLLTPSKELYPEAIGYNGKICGRTAGRISNACFIVDGNKYDLEVPEGHIHCLHGGVESIAYKEFNYSTLEDAEDLKAIFSYVSPDMEGGYPGELTITVTYTLKKKSNILELNIKYKSTKKTVCNLTNHVYFNLSGNCKENILNEELTINSSRVGLVDEEGLCYDVVDVPEYLDFRSPKEIGEFVFSEELEARKGYDNPFILNDDDLKASLYDEKTGRLLNMYSTCDTLVVYSDNYPESFILPSGKMQEMYDSVALEFQHFPNGVNSSFIEDKKDICEANKIYSDTTIFEFLTK